MIGLPLLLAALALRHRGLLRGRLLLTGALAWFLYVYASLALGTVVYNALFLAGVLVLRGEAAGFAAAVPLFVLEAFLLPMIAAQTVSRSRPASGLPCRSSSARWAGLSCLPY